MKTLRHFSAAHGPWLGPLAIIGALLVPGVLGSWGQSNLSDPGSLSGQPGVFAAIQHALFVLGLSIALMSAAMSAYHRTQPRRLLHVLFFFVLLELFYRFAYGGPISSGLLLSVSETSQRETLELLAGHPILTCSLSAVAILGLCALIASWKADIVVPTRRYRFGAVIAAVMIAGSLTIGALRLGDARTLGAAVRSDLEATYPLDLAMALRDVALDSLDTHRRAAARARFAFANTQMRDASARGAAEIYVIVVGETSRRGNWSLFGYPRPTTPRLDDIKQDLILFDRVSANATNTILSLPLVFTRATTETQQIARSQKSVVGLLKQAGFETFWISNQERSAARTNPISQIALDADHVSYTSDLRPDVQDGGLDSNLVSRFDDALRHLAANGKAVIVLHMEGSHFGYKDRYPLSAAQFADAQAAPRLLPARQLRLLNEYDNSIHFTDQVVRQLIDRLAACGCRSGLVYFSDHGERLFDSGLSDREFGHGFPTVSRQEIEVPLLFWLSAAYQTTNPASVSRLKANAHSIGQLHNLFETIVDLTGIEYAGRNSTLSLFSDEFTPPARLDVLNMQQATVTLSAL